jgi:hypothetical protein
MKRGILCLLFTLVAPVVVVALEAVPAHACSCVSKTDAAAFAAADAVFVGRVVGKKVPKTSTSSPDAASVWTFRVQDVYKGRVSPTQIVISASSSASCGLTLPRHVPILVFGNDRSSSRVPPIPKKHQLQANLCGGTRTLQDSVLDPSLGTPTPS